jgi:L-cysteine S-thiosulfotransferase
MARGGKVFMWKCLKVMGMGMVVIALAGCYPDPKSGKRLVLPEGDIEKGKAAFLALNCHECHRVDGVDFPAPVSTVATNIVLGGKVSRIQSYGELVTSVINPSHGLAEGFDKVKARGGELSPMPEFNETMTVSQMIDLIAFLQSRYEKVEPDYSKY